MKEFDRHDKKHAMLTKNCPRCSIVKPAAAFYVSSKTSRLSAYCKDCTRAQQCKWAADNRARKLEINAKWRRRNSGRRRMMMEACNTLWSAIRSGKVVRGTICSTCGSSNRIEASHENYRKPLDVVWLCNKCHRIYNCAEPKTLKKPKYPAGGMTP